MKAVIGTIILVIIFFIGATVFQNYVQNGCEELSEEITKLEGYIDDENWEMTRETLGLLKEDWEEKSKIWVLFLEHYNLDAIEVAIRKIDTYSDLKDKTYTLGEIVKLRYLIEHLSEREAFVLSNLL
ncbi:DUF4363 family protein [Alkaliphilus serpentinus]|nr:DUF4363 family protein [Alkaliphilus serpentinus]